jgi:hypothetical protein
VYKLLFLVVLFVPLAVSLPIDVGRLAQHGGVDPGRRPHAHDRSRDAVGLVLVLITGLAHGELRLKAEPLVPARFAFVAGDGVLAAGAGALDQAGGSRRHIARRCEGPFGVNREVAHGLQTTAK